MPIQPYDDTYRVYLQFILDRQAMLESNKGVADIDKQVGELEKRGYSATTAMQRLEVVGLQKIGKTSQEVQRDLAKQNRELERMQGAALKAGTSVEALEKRFRALRQVGRELSQVGIGLTAIGTAVFGGATLLANNYIKTMEEAGVKGDAIVDKWRATQDRIKHDQLELGRIFATEMLPLFEKGADILDRITDFAKENPELIHAIVNIGAILLAAGTLVTVVGKTIEGIGALGGAITKIGGLVGEGAKVSGGATALGGAGGATALGAAIGDAFVLAVAAYFGAEGGKAIGNAIAKEIYGEGYKQQDLSDAWETFKKIGVSAFGAIILEAEKLGVVTPQVGQVMFDTAAKMTHLDEASKKAADSVDDAADSVERLAKEAQGAAILQELRSSLNEMSRKYADDRIKIEEDAGNRLTDLHAKTRSQLTEAASAYTAQLSHITAQFQAQERQASQQYALQRANIVRSGGRAILEIEKRAQADLVKLRREHEERVYDLVLNRDALGLAREQRKYEEAVSERLNASSDEIKQRRADLAIQLQDAAANYRLQQQQRYQQYQLQLQEAQQQFQQRIESIREQDRLETEQIQRDMAARLRALQLAYQADYRNAVLAAYDKIKQLNGALTAERTMRQQFYALILNDATTFMSAYRRTLSGTGTVGARAGGGYAGYGVYKMGEEGNEFVLNSQSTRAAERLLGGALTQSRLIAALQGRKSVTLNDNRRINASIPPSERRELQKQTLELLNEAFA